MGHGAGWGMEDCPRWELQKPVMQAGPRESQAWVQSQGQVGQGEVVVRGLAGSLVNMGCVPCVKQSPPHHGNFPVHKPLVVEDHFSMFTCIWVKPSKMACSSLRVPWCILEASVLHFHCKPGCCSLSCLLNKLIFLLAILFAVAKPASLRVFHFSIK